MMYPEIMSVNADCPKRRLSCYWRRWVIADWLIQGQRIADVGPEGNVKIPAGAEEIDLGSGTIMPGLIDSHNHQFKIGDHPGADPDAAVPAVIQPGSVFSPGYVTLLAAKNAKLDLEAGFTTTRDLSSGGTLDVDLRNAINQGIIPGPRMVIATEGVRGSIDAPRYFHSLTRYGKAGSRCGCNSRTEPTSSRSTLPPLATSETVIRRR
jgi:hypothetical protein